MAWASMVTAVQNIVYKDILGQEISEGDFVVSGQRDGNRGKLGMGVMKDVSMFKRVSVSKYKEDVYQAGAVGRMGDYSHALKVPDASIAAASLPLFETVNNIREALKLPTNRELIYQVNEKESLTRILESKL